jgi:hypothetical protein
MIKPDIAEPVIGSLETMVDAKNELDKIPPSNSFLQMYHKKAYEMAVKAFTGTLETCQKLFSGCENQELSLVDKALELVNVSNEPEKNRASIMDAFNVREAEIERPQMLEQLDNLIEDGFDDEIESQMSLQ